MLQVDLEYEVLNTIFADVLCVILYGTIIQLGTINAKKKASKQTIPTFSTQQTKQQPCFVI